MHILVTNYEHLAVGRGDNPYEAGSPLKMYIMI